MQNDKTPLDWAKGMKRADLVETLNQVTAYRPGVSSPKKGVSSETQAGRDE